MDKTAVKPPSHLSKRAKKLWVLVVERRAKSPERLALLQTALESLDRADQCREQIESQGLLTETKTTGTKHLNPLLKLEKDSRQLFARIWRDLQLDWAIDLD